MVRSRPWLVPQLDLGRVDPVPGRHVERLRCRGRPAARRGAPRPVGGDDAPRRATSASSEVTVSTASDLLVPITPVGPRLIQPVTYSPAEKSPSRITRPSACGTRPVLSSNGTPGNGTPR